MTYPRAGKGLNWWVEMDELIVWVVEFFSITVTACKPGRHWGWSGQRAVRLGQGGISTCHVGPSFEARTGEQWQPSSYASTEGQKWWPVLMLPSWQKVSWGVGLWKHYLLFDCFDRNAIDSPSSIRVTINFTLGMSLAFCSDRNENRNTRSLDHIFHLFLKTCLGVINSERLCLKSFAWITFLLHKEIYNQEL